MLAPDQIAHVCHEANRALQAELLEPISPEWTAASGEMRRSAVDGVYNALNGSTPQESHENWLAFKRENGWTYGPQKDEERKTHPCMVAYEDLPLEQKQKDHLFIAIVEALS